MGSSSKLVMSHGCHPRLSLRHSNSVQSHRHHSLSPQPLLPLSSLLFSCAKLRLSSSLGLGYSSPGLRRTKAFSSLYPSGGETQSVAEEGDRGREEEELGQLINNNEEEEEEARGVAAAAASVIDAIPEEKFAIVSACLVGLLTGIGVVLFNNGVHELRDFFWDGIPHPGASWIREAPVSITWKRTVLVPVCGGVLVSVLNLIRDAMEVHSPGDLTASVKNVVFRPFLKSLAACVTLGTGNSLGPEGPSVEIGSSIAKGVGTLFGKNGQRKVSLTAAGSAAGISSGFNAAVAGCFFAVESVLWPSPSDSSTSLPNTTSMVILSAVIASVISAICLGSEPAFKVPNYDFRSPGELPLYLLLGVLCGLVSLVFSRCTTYMLQAADQIYKTVGVPKAVFPIAGSIAVGLIALAYPEILYRGFENVDLLLESRPFANVLPGDLLLQLVFVKIFATSICRASGLVGGYYAPSLFIGAATGMAYGKFIDIAISQSHSGFDISFFEVASPQAYGLVGMAATLAGVCQVPLTSVLLLFELTQDYRIVVPLLGAVGLSAWVTSSQTKRDFGVSEKLSKSSYRNAKDDESNSGDSLGQEASTSNALCEMESSLCPIISDEETEDLESRISVLQAMRTNYATVLMNTLLLEAVDIMLAEKQQCALIVDDDDNHLIGLLSLKDIEKFCKSKIARSRKPEVFTVGNMCSLIGEKCHPTWTVTPSTSLLTAEMLMARHSLTELPVILTTSRNSSRGQPVGIIDMESIRLACRAVATKEYLNQNSGQEP